MVLVITPIPMTTAMAFLTYPLDAFPLISTEYLDTDGDGIGNNTDDDDDGDGVLDVDDDFPLDSTASVKEDADGDGWPSGQDP